MCGRQGRPQNAASVHRLPLEVAPGPRCVRTSSLCTAASVPPALACLQGNPNAIANFPIQQGEEGAPECCPTFQVRATPCSAEEPGSLSGFLCYQKRRRNCVSAKSNQDWRAEDRIHWKSRKCKKRERRRRTKRPKILLYRSEPLRLGVAEQQPHVGCCVRAERLCTSGVQVP